MQDIFRGRLLYVLLTFVTLNVYGNFYQEKDMKELTVKKISADTISAEKVPAHILIVPRLNLVLPIQTKPCYFIIG